jgi:hypothetical protein
MTEDEAKTKWCPMRRITRIGNIKIDNTDGKEFTLNCIGSACMMWRFYGDQLHRGRVGNGAPLTEGYCGLSGNL